MDQLCFLPAGAKAGSVSLSSVQMSVSLYYHSYHYQNTLKTVDISNDKNNAGERGVYIFSSPAGLLRVFR